MHCPVEASCRHAWVLFSREAPVPGDEGPMLLTPALRLLVPSSLLRCPCVKCAIISRTSPLPRQNAKVRSKVGTGGMSNTVPGVGVPPQDEPGARNARARAPISGGRRRVTISHITPRAGGVNRLVQLFRICVRSWAATTVNDTLRDATRARHELSSLTPEEIPTDKTATIAERRSSRRSAFMIESPTGTSERGPN